MRRPKSSSHTHCVGFGGGGAGIGEGCGEGEGAGEGVGVGAGIGCGDGITLVSLRATTITVLRAVSGGGLNDVPSTSLVDTLFNLLSTPVGLSTTLVTTFVTTSTLKRLVMLKIEISDDVTTITGCGGGEGEG